MKREQRTCQIPYRLKITQLLKLYSKFSTAPLTLATISGEGHLGEKQHHQEHSTECCNQAHGHQTQRPAWFVACGALQRASHTYYTSAHVSFSLLVVPRPSGEKACFTALQAMNPVVKLSVLSYVGWRTLSLSFKGC